MRYTVIHLDTFEMKVVEEVSHEQMLHCREGRMVIVDMATGAELAPEAFEVMAVHATAAQATHAVLERKAA